MSAQKWGSFPFIYPGTKLPCGCGGMGLRVENRETGDEIKWVRSVNVITGVAVVCRTDAQGRVLARADREGVEEKLIFGVKVVCRHGKEVGADG